MRTLWAKFVWTTIMFQLSIYLTKISARPLGFTLMSLITYQKRYVFSWQGMRRPTHLTPFVWLHQSAFCSRKFWWVSIYRHMYIIGLYLISLLWKAISRPNRVRTHSSASCAWRKLNCADKKWSKVNIQLWWEQATGCIGVVPEELTRLETRLKAYFFQEYTGRYAVPVTDPDRAKILNGTWIPPDILLT